MSVIDKFLDVMKLGGDDEYDDYEDGHEDGIPECDFKLYG